jgi:hypothetical protein
MIKDKLLRRLLTGGILMVLFTLIGDILFFESLYIIGLDHLGEPIPSLYLTFFFVYIYIALYGGFSVIIGYYSFKKDFDGFGKFFTLLGLLLGIIAFIIFIITAIIDLTLIGELFLLLLVLFIITIGIGLVGLILSLTSYMKLLKITKNTS